MDAVTKIVLVDEAREKFFGEGPWRLLRGVEQTGSLRASAMEMGMAYSKAMRILRRAEAALGYPLTERTAGGVSGGGSILTPEGRAWMARYETFRDACIADNRALYPDFFPEEPDGPIGNFGCVIMASGLGRRFGENKLMVPFRGSPLISRTLDATQGLFTRRVVVTRHEAVADCCRSRGVDVIIHNLPDRNDTVRLGLETMADTDGCLFCPGDQPLLSRQTLRTLLICAAKEPEFIRRPRWEDRAGAPVFFPRRDYPELLSLPKGKGGGLVAKAHPERVRMLPVADRGELEDVDTPDDLLRLEPLCFREGIRPVSLPQWLGEVLDSAGCIALVGAGGKTSLLYALARESAARGERALVTTTTHIVKPEGACGSFSECEAAWSEGRYAVWGEDLCSGKLGALSDGDFSLALTADRILIEADGARHLACKAPAEHEPVIAAETDLVIAVVGLSVLGKTIAESCFRPELVAALLGCGQNHILTPEDLAELLISEQGLRKNVGSRPYLAVLNQCDSEPLRALGAKAATRLKEYGIPSVLTRLKQGEET